MTNNVILCLIVLLPLFGALLLPGFSYISQKLRNLVAFILVFLSFCLSLVLLPSVYNGQVTKIYLTLSSDIVFILQADMLSLFMALTSTMVASIIVIYSFGYMRSYENLNEYYMMVVLFVGSMMGLIFSQNLIMIYTFWELTGFASWRLIGFFREKNYIYRANKAFLITAFGALLMLVGFVMIYAQTGSFNLSEIKLYLGLHGESLSNIAIALILAGILSKSATLPFHSWLPDAGVAPSPVTGLLHAAVLVKIGVFMFAKLFVFTFDIPDMWHVIIPTIAAVSAIISAGCAIVETDIKRIIAYSTVSQIAFILLGLSIDNEIGIAGGLLYILMHSISKGGLFLCAGVIEHNTHTKDINKLGGLFKTMPITAISFLLCSFSIMGLPPFGGFFSKHMVLTGAIEAGQLAIALTFLVGAFMTIIYLSRFFYLVFMGENQYPEIKEGTVEMLTAIVILAGLSILSGIFVNIPLDLAQTTLIEMVVKLW